MFDAKSVLGTLLQAGLSPSTHRRLGSALGGGGAGMAGGLGGLDLGGTLGRVLQETQSGNPLAVGGLGALAGAVLGGGRGDLVRGAVGGGALAILGKLAYDALQNSAAGADAPTAAAATAPAAIPASAAPAAPASVPAVDEQANARLLLQAMLSAAKADGQIDGNEMQRIMGKLDEAGADAESKSFLLDEMRGPPDLDGLARQARSPAIAAQVYAASLLAIEVDTDAERDYMQRLATALGLEQATVDRLHAALGAQR